MKQISLAATLGIAGAVGPAWPNGLLRYDPQPVPAVSGQAPQSITFRDPATVHPVRARLPAISTPP